jgi:tRNA pseudouridine38-40 synthase
LAQRLSTTTEPAAPYRVGGLVRVRIDLGYDGGKFAGWAVQPGQRTVQGELESAIATVLRLPEPWPRLIVAGRTDAGVHALAQVAHIDLPKAQYGRSGAQELQRRLNGILPDDVRIFAVSVAGEGFDARFSALSREYHYRVCAAPAVPDPLRRHDTLAWERPLDLGLLQAASDRLLGEHDFAAYCRRREGATTLRSLRTLDWVSYENADHGLLVATVIADAFCHSMVRSLVGALLAVGDGRRPVEFPASLLNTGRRAGEVTVAPPHGLTLIRIRYPEPGQFAARASLTRALRTAGE